MHTYMVLGVLWWGSLVEDSKTQRKGATRQIITMLNIDFKTDSVPQCFLLSAEFVTLSKVWDRLASTKDPNDRSICEFLSFWDSL